MAESKLKIVLVGCGGMSGAWLGPICEFDDLQVVGLVDLNRAAAKARAAQYGLPESVVFDSLGDAIKAAGPDMVFDVTVPSAHHGVTMQALQAGCHVLGEKPMAERLDQAREMVATAAKMQKLYAVIQNRRYEPNVRRVKALIEAGMIGRVEELHCDFFLGIHFGGFREQMDHPLILDMAIHTFDAARYISQANAEYVYCHAFNPGRSWYRGDASAVAIFEMNQGITYTYRGSWCAEGLATSWQAQWRIIGERGTILWDGEGDVRCERAVVPGGGGFDRWARLETIPAGPQDLAHQGHAGLIREFADCVRSGGKPLTHCTDNIQSLAMVLAAVESDRLGRRVPVVV